MCATDMGTPSYTITVNDKSVRATSNFYIPYEPRELKGDIQQKVLEFRQDLRDSISCLKIEEQEMLLASYKEGKKNRFYDVENMLFYNIGGTGFRKAAPTQLAFLGDEKRFSDTDIPPDADACFIYDYQIVNIKQVEQITASKTTLAHWENINVDESIFKSPTRYFAAIRKRSDMVEVTGTCYDKALFGLKIELTTSYPSHPTATMKPLLDGIICAFHGEEDNTIRVLRDMFPGQADYLLSDHGRLNLFGSREYIKRYRGSHSFVWNPEDERLQFAWIIVKKGRTPNISGTIYKW